MLLIDHVQRVKRGNLRTFSLEQWVFLHPVEVFQQPGPIGEHNVWLGLWPFQVPIGIGLIFWGINRRDERFLVAASPFFWPYASTSSLLGPWIVMGTLLKDWQAALVLAGWWGAVVYRSLI